MTTATLPAPPLTTLTVTPEDLLKLGQQGLFELVDGRLVEKPMGALSGETATIISSTLHPFIRSRRLGELYSETTFCCFPHNPTQVRRPDLAFVAAGRVHLVPDDGHVPVRPDLAIEVVSPDDGVYDLDSKLRDYRLPGVPLPWVFNPAREIRQVRVFRPGRPSDELTDADTLSGEDVLPGFSAVLGDLFPPTPGT